MKTLNDDSSSNSFLGFSLSPQMKMEAPATFFFTPQLNNSGIFCYGVGDNGASSPAPFSVMEALSKSQTEGIVLSSSPKLEDFLGGATMGLSLDSNSMYYHQNAVQETNNHSLELLPHQDPSFSIQTNSYYPGLVSQMYQTPLEVENWINSHQQMNNGLMAEMGSGDLHSLTLSMSPGSQSSCITITPTAADCSALVRSRKRTAEKVVHKQPVHRKSLDTFGQRTSQYRGVTRHRWTGRYEAHLWDNSCKKEGQTRKGRQVYLGGYDMEEKAARAYDLAALKYWGQSTHINFPLENYRAELEGMKNMNRQEFVAHLRRKSSGFSRGASMYRGVTRHHQHGRWQARIGRVAGNKDLYLGTFSTQEEAAVAYDVAAIKFRGVNAVTNFDITKYHVEKIMASNTLLAGELARRNNETGSINEAIEYNTASKISNSGDSGFSEALQSLMGKDQNEAIIKQRASSSLVTSISGSSEGSPDKCGPTMVFAKLPLASKLISPTAEIRPAAISVASHLPVFAAWNET